ncbi:hypothetical protein FOZ61_005744 [Perkinsus olseni]|uniref:Uncharacterized protein n=1 Tax=Perkinsus olseni TaxID=32597 RepID=A0A7J6LG57_PEROL|nr:hypothetical protein FOZ61_005744 [Perkinsus olseni]
MPMHAALDGSRPDGNVEPQNYPDLRECAYCSNYRLAEGGPPPSDLSTSPSIEERSRLAALIDDKFLILHGENGVYCEGTPWASLIRLVFAEIADASIRLNFEAVREALRNTAGGADVRVPCARSDAGVGIVAQGGDIRKSKFPELERELALQVSRLLSVSPDDAAYNGLIASDAEQLLSDNTVPVNVREYFQLPSNV